MAGKFVILGSDGGGSDAEPPPPAYAAGANERLAAEGWERRHSVAADRVEESIELYRSLGFEVLTRELTSEDYDPICRECVAANCPSHVLIYTRRGAAEKLPGNEQSAGQA